MPSAGRRSDHDTPLPVTGSPSRTSPSRLGRATAGMALGTFLSRLTGFARLVALAAAVGIQTPLADGYNLANTTPNMVHDLVAGGVLAATAVPVFVARLTARDERRAWEDISAVVTLSIVTLVVATAALVAAAPGVVYLYTAARSAPNLAAERAAATFLLRLFAPQVAFYGIISVLTAVLNARRRFAAPMFVPIANNLITIGILLGVHATFPHPTLVSAAHDPALLLLLGLGTTGGVVVQALMLLPAVRACLPDLRGAREQADGQAPGRAGAGGPAGADVWERLERLGRPPPRRALHWRFQPGNEAVRTILGLSGWTLGFVVANQVALFIVLRLAFQTGTGGVSAYSYAYILFQLPFGIVAVSVMSAVQPGLA
ncbi:MAG: murein biosynthesis integral membrane protein MurJ, partial [Acidimicrobiales bacterium]